MNISVIIGLWLGASALTYVQFKRVVRRERNNPRLMMENPQMLIALNVITNTQLGHALIIIGSLIPIFWLLMAIDFFEHSFKK